MGMTLATLNIYDAERSSVTPMLAEKDQLREQNAPWLTIVPPDNTDEDTYTSLKKLAQKFTKGSSAVALLFFYFDDEMFSCALYQDGKKSASCTNDHSWAKLGKKFSELFGEDSPSKAFRYASHCNSIDEQIQLLEETIGTELCVIQEDEPRIVKRSDAMLREIKARESKLRKLKNQFVLTEIPSEEWPDELKYRQRLLELLWPQWKKYHLSNLLFKTDMKRYMIPNTEEMIAYPYTEDWNTDNLGHLFLMNMKTEEWWDLDSFSGTVCDTIMQTKNGGTVLLIVRSVLANYEFYDHPVIEGIYSVICLDKDGTEQWSFEPNPEFKYQTITHIHTSKQGVVTLFAPAVDGRIKADAVIWQIDGESGRLLRTLSYPYKDGVHHLIYVDTINAFLFCRPNELVLLNESLEELKRIKGYKGSRYFEESNFCGSVLWEGDCWNERYVSLFNIQNEDSHVTPLEIPAFVKSVLSDGRILATSGKHGNTLIVFDKEGLVTARCSVPGPIPRIYIENGAVYLVEWRGPDTHGLIYDELFDETTLHVWRLDAVPEPR